MSAKYALPSKLRASVAAGVYGMKPTSGACPGYLQANVVIMPSSYAQDFEEFCKRNYRACPLLYKSTPGQLHAGPLAQDSDIRQNIPAYEVFRNGKHEGRVGNIKDIFTQDMVTFYVGCSFSFEQALTRAGVPVRNIEQGCNVSMYRTSRDCDQVGPFKGKMVVSMRPVKKDHISTAVSATAPYVLAHGVPFHTVDHRLLLPKTTRLETPDYGDAVDVRGDEVPCFWCCGVTCLEAVKSANLPIVITHSPGCMFVTDVKEEDLFSISDSPILMGATQRAMQHINSIEYAIKEDPGGRNVNALTLPNQLWSACHALHSATHIAITTGFPCLVTRSIPTESDGPLGALSLARTLVLLGKQVTLVVDPANMAVMTAALQRARELVPALADKCSLVEFNADNADASDSSSDDQTTRARAVSEQLLSRGVDAVVAVERAGVASSGHYHTMRAAVMDQHVQPIDHLFTLAQERGVATIGVGDGGNELGMGKVLDLVKEHVPRGEEIACVVGCDYLISAGVSNWGADGLAAGAVALATSNPTEAEPLLPDVSFEKQVLQACFAAGCRDGVKPEADMSVDGMAFDAEHVAKIDELRAILLAQN
ncbi:hypothetical protein PTSG_03849 [Salpingoeca rosetta]|uniref:D-glutamate cyclase-like C-terminal domain-containing protein n=1 Tax=Salpingoeca rosetta (strain ATCC 50818 / BSB-021) TaxID=946362 RepID=F2U5K1_SALR5|nr:uncharacterized protein PTSG_03849 [Salpingoeca rosetta]EGD83217.1 hypothetical protein PTSG_03849 [Salpingoeca rosetta]|eukprot:XP_004995581.1 hypothetical protein PTSG_03849 [Salpingoeca rosetta]